MTARRKLNESAAIPVVLICPDPFKERIELSSELANIIHNSLAHISGFDGLGKKRAPRFFPRSFSLDLENWTLLCNCRELKIQTCHLRHPGTIIRFPILSELIDVEGKYVIAAFVNPDAELS